MTQTEVFQALEHEMVDANLRGHVYITKTSVILSATATRRGTRKNCHKGSETVQYAMDRILGGRGRSDEWLHEFQRHSSRNENNVAPIAWNTKNNADVRTCRRTVQQKRLP